MENPTGFPDLNQFDASIPETARQKLRTSLSEDVEPSSTSASLVEQRVAEDDFVRERKLRLVLVGAETEDNDYFDDDVVAAGSYLYWPADGVALVGGVSVVEQFRRRGIGTRLKQHLDNHIRQDGNSVAYTWIASGAGAGLAHKTGYRPENDVFADVGEFWAKRFD